jgi:DNA-binding beta-propeller fold protein YncE
MKTLALVVLLLGLLDSARAATLIPTRTIPLAGVQGRIDHLAADANGGRLFVAALGNNTVEIVDLKEGKVVHTITGLSEPQGVFYVREFNHLFVANGGDGALRVYDGTTFSEITAIKFDGDADNVRYDETAKQIYVGYGSGALGMVDAKKNVVVGNITLKAHPESFQLEKDGTRIFVNMPWAHDVTVLDRKTKITVGTWSLGLVAANFPMALDDVNHRAFVACRVPARLLVFDTISGEEVARLYLHGDCDDVFYDPVRHQIYASCGEGFIDIFSQTDADEYASKEAVKTAAKARTCFFDGDHLYLAVPRRGDESAQLRVYNFSR